MSRWISCAFVGSFAAQGAFFLPVRPTPLGIGIGVLIVILVALNLTLDFGFIENATAEGVPRFVRWYGAFGPMLPLIWIHVSVLLLLALLRARRQTG